MIAALIYRNVPRKKATELMLLGEQISAEEAERIGIVNRVVPAGEFEDAVRDWAERLAAKSPVMMRLGKDSIFRQLDMSFIEALDYLRAQLTLAFSTEDIQEGVKAFFEKREPNVERQVAASSATPRSLGRERDRGQAPGARRDRVAWIPRSAGRSPQPCREACTWSSEQPEHRQEIPESGPGGWRRPRTADARAP